MSLWSSRGFLPPFSGVLFFDTNARKTFSVSSRNEFRRRGLEDDLNCVPVPRLIPAAEIWHRRDVLAFV